MLVDRTIKQALWPSVVVSTTTPPAVTLRYEERTKYDDSENTYGDRMPPREVATRRPFT